jgi:hypothetical protein
MITEINEGFFIKKYIDLEMEGPAKNIGKFNALYNDGVQFIFNITNNGEKVNLYNGDPLISITNVTANPITIMNYGLSTYAASYVDDNGDIVLNVEEPITEAGVYVGEIRLKNAQFYFTPQKFYFYIEPAVAVEGGGTQ